MHLCAKDCQYVSVCPWATMRPARRQKCYDEGKFPIEGLKVKKFILYDCQLENVAYKVTKCPKYHRDSRSRDYYVPPKPNKGIRKGWTAADLNFLKENYGRMRYADIARRLGRSEACINSTLHSLRRKGELS